MGIISLKKVSKKYLIEKDKTFFALKDVSLTFPDTGLVSIVGKSGCGKSTLLNIISGLDKPSSGIVYFNNGSISGWKKERLEDFHNYQIGIVFQQYHLLSEETALYNVMLPMIVMGKTNKRAEQDAIYILNKLGITKDIYEKQSSLLSGGEKERVAIARALINAPKVLLCDEPTGALDSKNSIVVMNILKKISTRRLVIIVSHNKELVSQYSDRIISLKDGQIVSDEIINTSDKKIPIVKEKNKRNNKSWIFHFMKSNFKNRKKRNLFVSLALVIGLTFFFLSFGLKNGYQKSLNESIKNQFDFHVCEIKKEVVNDIPGSKIKLVQNLRPTKEEIQEFEKRYPNSVFELNASYLVPNILNIHYNGLIIKDLLYNPIYSFSNDYIDKTLLINGQIPLKDNLNEVVINTTAYNLIKKKTNKEPLNMVLSIENSIDTIFQKNQDGTIIDTFTYQRKIKITGIIKEMKFLSSPIIYYSYSSLINYLSNSSLQNLSNYKGENISWYERLSDVLNNDLLSSYSYYMFVKLNNVEKIITYQQEISAPLMLTNTSLEKGVTLINLVNALSIGLNVFTIIGLIGTFLILGITAFASYLEDSKKRAILSSFGARKSSVETIYLFENLSISYSSLLISLTLSVLFSKIINLIISKSISINNIIDIPLLIYKDRYLFLIIISILFCFVITLLFVGMPILFSKRLSIKDELQSL